MTDVLHHKTQIDTMCDCEASQWLRANEGTGGTPEIGGFPLLQLPRDVIRLLCDTFLGYVDLYVLMRVCKRFRALAMDQLSRRPAVRVTNAILFPQVVTIYTALCKRFHLNSVHEFNCLFRLLRFERRSYDLALPLCTLQKAITGGKSRDVQRFDHSEQCWQQWRSSTLLTGEQGQLHHTTKVELRQSRAHGPLLVVRMDAAQAMSDILKRALQWRAPVATMLSPPATTASVPPRPPRVCLVAPHENYHQKGATLSQRQRATQAMRSLCALYQQRGFHVCFAATSEAHQDTRWSEDLHLPLDALVAEVDQGQVRELAQRLAQRWQSEGRLRETSPLQGPVWRLDRVRTGCVVFNKRGEITQGLRAGCAAYLRRMAAMRQVAECHHYVFFELKRTPVAAALIFAELGKRTLLDRHTEVLLRGPRETLSDAIISHRGQQQGLGPLFCLNAVHLPQPIYLNTAQGVGKRIARRAIHSVRFDELTKRNRRAIDAIGRALGRIQWFCGAAKDDPSGSSSGRIRPVEDFRRLNQFSCIWSNAVVQLALANESTIRGIGERLFREIYRLTTNKVADAKK